MPGCSYSMMRSVLVLVVLMAWVGDTQSRPQFNFGSLFTNGLGAVFNTAIARDCRGRAQGDYFYGCQCVGPFNIGRKRRSPIFLNSNQGVGGDFIRCSVGTVLNRRG
eukprot:TRINITY_DN6264_c0_g1_i1.p1 TRINITY_DN6264_c0_g1~~TRINITY_DN6264_c0_g1_i1.p1  ORF type:complete len:107 (-),score=26.43 TRINITY_DN6264_c0_g1_i1:88-408(-)